MAPVFRAAADAQNSQGPTTVTVPAGVQPGDLGVVVLMAGDPTLEAEAAGWTKVLGTVLVGSAARYQIHTRIFQAGDDNVTFSWPAEPGSGNNKCALAVWVSGTSGVTWGSHTAVNTAARVCPGMTVVPDSLVFALTGVKGGGSGFPSSITWSDGLTTTAARFATGNYYPGLAVAGWVAAGSSTTDRTGTWNFSGANGFGQQLAFAPPAQPPPTVTAGTDQTVRWPGTVTLTSTSQGQGGATITARAWTQIGGDATTITNPAGASATVTPDPGFTAKDRTFRVTVTDSNGLTATDDVQVTTPAHGEWYFRGDGQLRPERHVFVTAQPPPFATGLPRRVFAETSFWTRPLPADAPLDSGSAAKRDFLIDRGIAGWGNPTEGFPSFTLNNYNNTAPIVVVDNTTPVVNAGAGMTLSDNGGGPYFNNLRAMFQGVRLPAGYVHNVGGTDKFLIVYNKDTDTYWDFWVVENDAAGWPGWSAQRGQRIENASTKQGIAEEYPTGIFYGSNAAGLAEVGGVIKLQELEEGLVPHVLNITLPVACIAHKTTVGISAPAVRSDGSSLEPGAIQMGQRIRLPAGFDVDGPNYHPVTRAVARAFRDYGAVVMDRSGDISFRGENRTGLVDGAARWAAVLAPAEPHNVMWGTGGYAAFPWASLQVLAPNYLAP